MMRMIPLSTSRTVSTDWVSVVTDEGATVGYFPSEQIARDVMNLYDERRELDDRLVSMAARQAYLASALGGLCAAESNLSTETIVAKARDVADRMMEQESGD